jgi:predicted DNA-binding WGR domain protein
MKRTFTLGSAADRRITLIEIQGAHLTVKQKKTDGTIKRNEKEFPSEAAARAECERVVGELLARGFVEQSAGSTPKAKPVKRQPEPDGVDPPDLYGVVESSTAAEGPVLARLAAAPATEAAPKKKKAGGKKKKKQAQSADGLDKRVLAGVGLVGLVGVGLLGFLLYDAFLKPSSIVGIWAGSMIDFEIGKPMIYTKYRLVLDDQRHASMTLQEKFTSVGTYTVKGNLLKLNLKGEKDDDGQEGEPVEKEYKISLGRATLDLYDPSSGKQLVQLIRSFEKPSAKSAAAPPPPQSAPKDLVALGTGAVDKDADAQLASVEFAPKDTAFRLRYPKGWTPETGSRPDNTYSWATFTQGSAKIQVLADIKGSLLAGSPNANYEEGSELAPVHGAHEQYRKTAAEEFSDYKESEPTLFKGAGLGEGRIGLFNASTGMLGSKVRGYRVTLLTNDRRVTVLCQAPVGEFEKLKPTFLAVARSLSR